jgi:hypothetical protein
MLKSNGTVDYYLNPNNYAFKVNGSSSDIANTSYNGNAMMEFPTIWFNRYEDSNYEYCYIAKTQVNSNFHAYAHHDMSGTVKDHCYVAIYNGSYSNNKLRSLSGQTCMVSQTAPNEISRAQANGTGWYTGVHADREMINDLLVLISRSTNGQSIFGNGNSNASAAIKTGTLNSKGLFYGKSATNSAMKVFGIENYWGNIWQRIAGKVRNGSGITCVKMTWGTEDGSTTTGYNTTGSGYISTGCNVSSNQSYIKDMQYSAVGRIEKTVGGSATTYYPDGLWTNTNTYACVGGNWGYGSLCGPFACTLDNAASFAAARIGASLSYK